MQVHGILENRKNQFLSLKKFYDLKKSCFVYGAELLFCKEHTNAGLKISIYLRVQYVPDILHS